MMSAVHFYSFYKKRYTIGQLTNMPVEPYGAPLGPVIHPFSTLHLKACNYAVFSIHKVVDVSIGNIRIFIVQSYADSLPSIDNGDMVW
jgi:hypothetical protein